MSSDVQTKERKAEEEAAATGEFHSANEEKENNEEGGGDHAPSSVEGLPEDEEEVEEKHQRRQEGHDDGSTPSVASERVEHDVDRCEEGEPPREVKDKGEANDSKATAAVGPGEEGGPPQKEKDEGEADDSKAAAAVDCGEEGKPPGGEKDEGVADDSKPATVVDCGEEGKLPREETDEGAANDSKAAEAGAPSTTSRKRPASASQSVSNERKKRAPSSSNKSKTTPKKESSHQSQSPSAPLPTSSHRTSKPTQEANWRGRYLELKCFVQENGHCFVPRSNRKLCYWTDHQRTAYNNCKNGKYAADKKKRHSRMTPERMALLEELGIGRRKPRLGRAPPGTDRKKEEETRTKIGAVTMETTAEIIERKVPPREKDSDGGCEGLVKDEGLDEKQAEGITGSTKPRRVAKPKGPNKHDQKWATQYVKLEAYHAEHGNSAVPHDYAADRRLAMWCAAQRILYKKYKEGKKSSMNEERAAKLEALGFVKVKEMALSAPPASSPGATSASGTANGITSEAVSVKSTSTSTSDVAGVDEQDPEGRNTSTTATTIEYDFGNSRPKQESKWWQRLSELQDYKREFGHCLVPKKYPINQQLAFWVDHQRAHLKKHKDGVKTPLNEERIQALEELGFVAFGSYRFDMGEKEYERIMSQRRTGRPPTRDEDKAPRSRKRGRASSAPPNSRRTASAPSIATKRIRGANGKTNAGTGTRKKSKSAVTATRPSTAATTATAPAEGGLPGHVAALPPALDSPWENLLALQDYHAESHYETHTATTEYGALAPMQPETATTPCRAATMLQQPSPSISVSDAPQSSSLQQKQQRRRSRNLPLTTTQPPPGPTPRSAGASSNPRDEMWSLRFKELSAFRNEHGHVRVPRNCPLGHWARYQRREYVKWAAGERSRVSDERAHLLETIGFGDTGKTEKREEGVASSMQKKTNIRVSREVRWASKLEELRAFVAEHGHCFVPRDSSQLGYWVDHQRTALLRYKKGQERAKNGAIMNSERAASLEELGIGRRKPKKSKPSSRKKKDNAAQGAADEMREAKVKPLNKHDQKWELRYGELKAFSEENGSCFIPCEYPPNQELATWVNNQRTLYKAYKEGKKSSINKERAAKLESISFHQKRPLKKDKKRTKNTPSASSSGQGKAKVKGRDAQSQDGKRTSAAEIRRRKKEKAEAMKISAHIKQEEIWRQRLEELRAFLAEFGHSHVPKKYPPNVKLGTWCDRQRTEYKRRMNGRHSLLNDERLEALLSVGFFSPKPTAADEVARAALQMEEMDVYV